MGKRRALKQLYKDWHGLKCCTCLRRLVKGRALPFPFCRVKRYCGDQRWCRQEHLFCETQSKGASCRAGVCETPVLVSQSSRALVASSAALFVPTQRPGSLSACSTASQPWLCWLPSIASTIHPCLSSVGTSLLACPGPPGC